MLLILVGLLLSIRPRKSNTAGFADVTINGLGFSQEGMQCIFNGTSGYYLPDIQQQDSTTRVAGSISILRCVPPLWGGNNLPVYPAHGLVATYYNSDNFSNPISARIVPDVEFSSAYGVGTVASLSANEFVSLRWAGFLQPLNSQTFTFFAAVSDVDERARLWIDNTLVVDMWVSLAGTECSGTIGLWMAAEYYAIEIQYKQGTGSMGISLLWESLSFSKSKIDSSSFLPESGWGHTKLQIAPENHGLFATYYGGGDFATPLLSFISVRIQNDGKEKALSLAGENDFSVRWAGFLKPQYAEKYTLYAAVSGEQERIRLWVDNILLVDMWSSLAGTEGSGTAVFGIVDGFYDVTMEYRQQRSQISAIISWEAESVPKQNIGMDSLYLNSDSVSPLVNGATRFTLSGSEMHSILYSFIFRFQC